MPGDKYKATQLSVFLENRAGRLSEVIHILAKAGINLRAISLADTSDFGILRLMLDQPGKAEEILKKHSCTTGQTSVVVVEVPDRPGGLDDMLQPLSEGGINVEYMYAYAAKCEDRAIMVIRFDKIDEAITVLLRGGASLIQETKLADL